MAWTTPRTWSAGELVTASMMNTHIRDNQIYLFDNIAGGALDDLSDVDITSVGANEVLGYSSGWKNRTLAEAGIAAAALVILADGTAPLTAAWDAGAFEIRAATFEPDTAGPATPAINNLYTDNIVKAWVNFNGTGTIAIRDDYNVASLTDDGTGLYTINFGTNMSNANYAALANAIDTNAGGGDRGPSIMATAVGSVQVQNADAQIGEVTDADLICVLVIGD